jgi:hypothetical protein
VAIKGRAKKKPKRTPPVPRDLPLVAPKKNRKR